MKALLRIFTVTGLMILSVNFFSCSDDLVSPKNTVSGKIYSSTKAALSNLQVTIQNKTTTTASDGSYSLNDIVFPYDALITDASGQYKTLHRNLNVPNADLIMSYIDRSSLANLEITLPDSIFNTDLAIILIFSDGKNISNYKYVDRFTLPSVISMGLGYAELPYTGKLYLLTYKLDNQSRIISYENFGVSEDIVIAPGGNLNYTFTSGQISFNPGELDVPVNINLSGNTNFSFCQHYIGFSKEKIYNGQFISMQTFEDQIVVKIPDGLPVQSYNYLNCYSNQITGNSTEQFLLEPGGQNNFTVTDNPLLMTPPHEAVVTDTTKFTFTYGDGEGIYNLFFYETGYFTSVFQSSASLEYKDIKDLVQNTGSSGRIHWFVIKYGKITSIDNFTKEFFGSQEYFKTDSDVRIFNFK
ncbi:MAG: carboxypeptidase regulatory-like domain-containing protein [Ignavibacteria bacterium]|nr:carboxypeptidase regulatory-like domain-containing protein [Ignavibacteria bacterium]